MFGLSRSPKPVKVPATKPTRATDQTDPGFTQRVPWQTGPSYPGIDDAHTFVVPDQNYNQLYPYTGTDAQRLPTKGPWLDSRAPAQGDPQYWQARNIPAVQDEKHRSTTVMGQNEPQYSTQRPQDPRAVTVPTTRPTQHVGPAVYLVSLNTFFANNRQRFTGAHASFAPAVNPGLGGATYGNGARSFRLTDRVQPVRFETNVTNVRDQSPPQNPLATVGSAPLKWW